MNEIKTKAFAAALSRLCHEHQIMLWTAIPTVPIMATEVTEDDRFHYEVGRHDILSAVILRVLE